eukprot:Gregarina_sp_Pseudo_9__1505@NODE_2011_length_1202_cov_82_147034_g1857_i0_p1_GENE_NODE_2011_length_1202_cov_82_147034_g1857_i0NODE_2011_length_1202_cov_82_147034_g1857_i0_p1_ORF_typecomplete_len206_score48_30NESP55/PF06390_12/0_0018Mucin/PF01456_17/0_0045NicO/PF03824_16/0_67_NODE_2011_length_1202_cov_82_147034_g1857_i05831176
MGVSHTRTHACTRTHTPHTRPHTQRHTHTDTHTETHTQRHTHRETHTETHTQTQTQTHTHQCVCPLHIREGLGPCFSSVVVAPAQLLHVGQEFFFVEFFFCVFSGDHCVHGFCADTVSFLGSQFLYAAHLTQRTLRFTSQSVHFFFAAPREFNVFIVRVTEVQLVQNIQRPASIVQNLLVLSAKRLYFFAEPRVCHM